ncbi:hypothetical protein [Microbacterium sp. SORGH_AS_0421]|uniref:hypothetical protein n=1 Tax=Microbacterium sp. SORGH_AS_0421 TaxID=3041768 RepID=UPI002790181A|nr:hypothetical protein [Microbacterium sp. SORGH_AS_0421]
MVVQVELDARRAPLLAHLVPRADGLHPGILGEGSAVPARDGPALTQVRHAQHVRDLELLVDVGRGEVDVRTGRAQAVVVEQLADLLRGDRADIALRVARELDLRVADAGQLLEHRAEAQRADLVADGEELDADAIDGDETLAGADRGSGRRGAGAEGGGRRGGGGHGGGADADGDG